MNQEQNPTCTLEILSKGEFNCHQECKLRTISGLPGNGEKFTGPACEVLAEELESIRMRLSFSDEQLVQIIKNPTLDSNECFDLKMGFYDYYTEE